MRWLLVALMLLFSNTASAQTLPDIITKINSTLPTARSITAANLRSVLNYMAGANSLTSGLTSTINSTLTSGSALSASTVVTVLEDFTTNLGLTNQLNTYISGSISSGSRISAAGLRKVLITLANSMFAITQFSLPNGDSLHYMAQNGNDACNGLSPAIGSSGTCAWATPNHALNCGDVIIAAPSSTTYGSFGSHGTVSNCPSTTGGIDGNGGIWAAVVLCGGTDLGTSGNGCILTAVSNNKNFWAYINWRCEANGAVRCYELSATGGGTTQVHHQMYINDIANNSLQGFDTDDGAANHNVPGSGGDYAGIVANAYWNSSQDHICLAALDFVAPSAFDSLSGTHLYAYGNFIGKSHSPACATSTWVTGTVYQPGCSTSSTGSTQWCGTYVVNGGNVYILQNASNCTSGATIPSGTGTNISDGGCTWNFAFGAGGSFDSEAMMLDTLDAHGYTGQIVVANNITWQSDRAGLQFTHMSFNASSPIIKVYNNTFYNDDQSIQSDFGDGAINLCGTSSWVTTVINNISVTRLVTSGNNEPMFATVLGCGLWSSLTFGGTGQENVLKGSAVTAHGTCDTTLSICVFNGNTYGAQTFKDPGFQNENDVNNNWTLSAFDCPGVATTTACMGYNVLTQTLTAHKPIADLVPSCAGCSGKGYQLPSMNCNTNADYPSYLKGLVRLEWISGSSTIVQVRDLVTVPCGL